MSFKHLQRRRGSRSVSVCAGEGHPSRGAYLFLTREMGTGSVQEGRLRRKKELFVTFEAFRSVFSFQKQKFSE